MSINLIDKYLSRQDIREIKSLKESIEKDNITVTCMGLYNHGKSTLLNVLIKDFEHKIFKTADVRETTKNKKIKYNQFTYVDTPGLNTNKHDDKRVRDAVKDSDINIFVHNVNTGEFIEKEISFFLAVEKYWEDPQEFIDRTIFVLSKIDEVQSDEDIENAILKMNQQIKEIFHTQAQIIPVSAKDYQDGMLEHEKELIEISNIKYLETKLEELSANAFIQETKKRRLTKHYDTLMQHFESEIQKKQFNINRLQSEKRKYKQMMTDDLKKIEEILTQKYQVLQEVF